MLRLNRLHNKMCYIIGYMQSCPNNGEGWRNEIIPFLTSVGVKVFNPCRKPVDFGLEDRETRELVNSLLQKEKYDEVRELMKPIRAVDLRMVDKSDFLIFNLDNNFPTCGSHEEWVTANRQKKPIIVRCEQGKSAIPNWMFGALPHELFFSTWQEVTNYLKHIDESPCFDAVGRWVFFDYEKMHNPITS